MSELPTALRGHRQLEMMSCAVSAFEAIAKLHDLVKPDAFPLQSNPANQSLGFGDTGFLRSLGLVPKDDHYPLDDTLGLVTKEANEGRFPLVSLIEHQKAGKNYWHICLVALHNGELLLIDPAVPRVRAEGHDGIRKQCEDTLRRAPHRPRIHVLTYSLPRNTARRNPKNDVERP